jgi:ATP-GRASP peptide maturase of grasp-with-spasm system
MIVIITQHEAEYTTSMVIDWLGFMNEQFRIINGKEVLFDFDCRFDNHTEPEINMEPAGITADKIVIWYRRWLPQDFYPLLAAVSPDVKTSRQFLDYYREEGRVLKYYFLKSLKPGYVLTDYFNAYLNKLQVLAYASRVGLCIPATIITSKKSVLGNFINEHKKIIVKNISEVGMFTHKKKMLVTFTAGLTAADLEKLPLVFFPGIFQEHIDKLYEIRVFYMEGTCYSMAIFSQKNDKTATDFRNYDFKNPNRNVPYQLPTDVEVKIDLLMKAVGLNCGSLDLIRSCNGEYVFLEINPIGQFGMISEPCNYHLELKVAELLIEKQKLNA